MIIGLIILRRYYIIEFYLAILYYLHVFVRSHGQLRFVFFEFLTAVEADVRIFHGLAYLVVQLTRILLKVDAVVFGWL